MSSVPMTAGSSGPSSMQLSAAALVLGPMVDQEPGLRGSSISYISNDQACVIRKSDSVIETNVIITPGPSQGYIGSKRFYDGLVEVGFDCGFAAASYAGTAALCGSTFVTAGAAAPLCVVALSGSVAGSWKCGTSIGNMYRAANDPSFERRIETDPTWYTDLNTAMDWVDNASATLDLARGGRQLYSLGKLGAAHAGKVARYTRKQSVAAYRELAEALGESFSVQRTKRWINEQGHNLRFSTRAVKIEFWKALQRAGVTTGDLFDDQLKDQTKKAIPADKSLKVDAPPYCFHVLQRAQP